MKSTLDLRLYVLIDPERCGGRPPADIARAAARGGATLFQYRDKIHQGRQQIEQVRSILEAVAPSNIPVLVNDRVDVALAAGAHGVHLGQDDMTVIDARRLMGNAAIIGGTVHFPEEAETTVPASVDYVGLGPVFATSSKPDNDPPLGVEGLVALRRHWRHHAPGSPACAIAGINADNAAAVLSAGVEGLAVISAIGMADDVEAATRRLRQVIERVLGERQAA